MPFGRNLTALFGAMLALAEVRRGNRTIDYLCYYTICGNRDIFLKGHEELLDERGFLFSK